MSLNISGMIIGVVIFIIAVSVAPMIPTLLPDFTDQSQELLSLGILFLGVVAVLIGAIDHE